MKLLAATPQYETERRALEALLRGEVVRQRRDAVAGGPTITAMRLDTDESVVEFQRRWHVRLQATIASNGEPMLMDLAPEQRASIGDSVVFETELARLRAALTPIFETIRRFNQRLASGTAGLGHRPEVIAFQRRWRVLVQLALSVEGELEIAYLDDHFPLPPTVLRADLLSRLRAPADDPDRFLVIDGRVPKLEAIEFVRSKLRGGRRRRLPVKLDKGRLVFDLKVVERAPETGLDCEDVAAKINPHLADAVGHRRGLGADRTGNIALEDDLEQWDRLVRKVKRHWAGLRSLVLPTES
jgi:hypothetical protein